MQKTHPQKTNKQTNKQNKQNTTTTAKNTPKQVTNVLANDDCVYLDDGAFASGVTGVSFANGVVFCILRSVHTNEESLTIAQFAVRAVHLTVAICILFLRTSNDVCRLLITPANSLDPDEARQNVGPHLDQNGSTLWCNACPYMIF